MAQLAPVPKFTVTYVDGSGAAVPAVGYKLYTYTAGTSTPKATYTDYTLGSANTNPVVMDTNGQCDLWLNGNYKFVLKTDLDVLVWTVDEVRDLTSSQTLTNMTLAGTLTVSSTAITWSGNPTHSGNHTWTGNQVFKGNVTIGDSSVDALTITPNAVAWSNNPTHSGNHVFSGTVTIAGAQTLTGVTTFSSNPAGKVIADTYSPTITDAANTSARSATNATYTRVGDIVTVSMFLSITTAASATSTSVFITLPIASNLTAITDVVGQGVGDVGASPRVCGLITGVSATDKAQYLYWSTTNGVESHNIWFRYKIV